MRDLLSIQYDISAHKAYMYESNYLSFNLGTHQFDLCGAQNINRSREETDIIVIPNKFFNVNKASSCDYHFDENKYSFHWISIETYDKYMFEITNEGEKNQIIQLTWHTPLKQLDIIWYNEHPFIGKCVRVSLLGVNQSPKFYSQIDTEYSYLESMLSYLTLRHMESDIEG